MRNVRPRMFNRLTSQAIKLYWHNTRMGLHCSGAKKRLDLHRDVRRAVSRTKGPLASPVVLPCQVNFSVDRASVQRNHHVHAVIPHPGHSLQHTFTHPFTRPWSHTLRRPEPALGTTSTPLLFWSKRLPTGPNSRYIPFRAPGLKRGDPTLTGSTAAAWIIEASEPSQACVRARGCTRYQARLCHQGRSWPRD